MATISKTLTFEAPKFSQSFSPLCLGSACGLTSGGGSRGRTPLHFAAEKGAEGIVQRLLEAKAAVDAKDRFSCGLGQGFGGKPHEAWDGWEDVDEILMVQVFRGYF